MSHTPLNVTIHTQAGVNEEDAARLARIIERAVHVHVATNPLIQEQDGSGVTIVVVDGDQTVVDLLERYRKHPEVVNTCPLRVQINIDKD